MKDLRDLNLNSTRQPSVQPGGFAGVKKDNFGTETARSGGISGLTALGGVLGLDKIIDDQLQSRDSSFDRLSRVLGFEDIAKRGQENYTKMLDQSRGEVKQKLDTMRSKSITSSKSVSQAIKDLDVNYIFQSLVQSSGQMAMSLTPATLPLLVGTTVGNEYEQMLESTGGKTDGNMRAMALLSGTLQAGVDRFTGSQLISGNIAKKVLGEAVKDTAFKKLSGMLGRATFDAGLEGITETLQQLTSNAFQKAYNKDLDIKDGLLESLIMGSIGGGVFSGTFSTLGQFGIKASDLLDQRKARQAQDKMAQQVQVVEAKMQAKEQAIQNGTYQIGDTAYDLTPQEIEVINTKEKLDDIVMRLQSQEVSSEFLKDGSNVKINIRPEVISDNNFNVKYDAYVDITDANGQLIETVKLDEQYDTEQDAIQALADKLPPDITDEIPLFKIINDKDAVIPDNMFDAGIEMLDKYYTNGKKFKTLEEETDMVRYAEDLGIDGYKRVGDLVTAISKRMEKTIDDNREVLLDKNGKLKRDVSLQKELENSRRLYKKTNTPEYKSAYENSVKADPEAMRRVSQFQSKHGVEVPVYLAKKIKSPGTGKAIGMYYKGAITATEALDVIGMDHELSHYALDNWDNIDSLRKIGFSKEDLFNHVRELHPELKTDIDVNEKISDYVELLSAKRIEVANYSMIKKFFKALMQMIKDFLGLSSTDTDLINKYYSTVFPDYDYRLPNNKIIAHKQVTQVDIDKFAVPLYKKTDTVPQDATVEVEKRAVANVTKSKAKTHFLNVYLKKQLKSARIIKNKLDDTTEIDAIIKELEDIKKSIPKSADDIELLDILEKTQEPVSRKNSIVYKEGTKGKEMTMKQTLDFIYQTTPTIYKHARQSVGIKGSLEKATPKQISELYKELRARFETLQKRGYVEIAYSMQSDEDKLALAFQQSNVKTDSFMQKVYSATSDVFGVLENNISRSFGSGMREKFRRVDSEILQDKNKWVNEFKPVFETIDSVFSKDRKLSEKDIAIVEAVIGGNVDIKKISDIQSALSLMMHNFTYETPGAEKGKWRHESAELNIANGMSANGLSTSINKMISIIKQISGVDIEDSLIQYYNTTDRMWADVNDATGGKTGYLPGFVPRRYKDGVSDITKEEAVRNKFMRDRGLSNKDIEGNSERAVKLRDELSLFIAKSIQSPTMNLPSIGLSKFDQRLTNILDSDMSSLLLNPFESAKIYVNNVSYTVNMSKFLKVKSDALLKYNELQQGQVSGDTIKEVQDAIDSFILDAVRENNYSAQERALLRNFVNVFMMKYSTPPVLSKLNTVAYSLLLGRFGTAISNATEFGISLYSAGGVYSSKIFNPTFRSNILKEIGLDEDMLQMTELDSFSKFADKMTWALKKADAGSLKVSAKNFAFKIMQQYKNKNSEVYKRIVEIYGQETGNVLNILDNFDINNKSQEIPRELAVITVSYISETRAVGTLGKPEWANTTYGKIFLPLKTFAYKMSNFVYDETVGVAKSGRPLLAIRNLIILSAILGLQSLPRALYDSIVKGEEPEKSVMDRISNTLLGAFSAGWLNTYLLSQIAKGDIESAISEQTQIMGAQAVIIPIKGLLIDVIKGKDISQNTLINTLPGGDIIKYRLK